MRLNQFLAQATGISRRQADVAISNGRVKINGSPVSLGQTVEPGDTVTLDGKAVAQKTKLTTIILNKPVGYVCSRNGQGSRTVYDLLPPELHELKPVGRLDKDSSGLLLLTNDGVLANELTHPRYAKTKAYEVELHKPLDLKDQQQIAERGVPLEDGPSKLGFEPLEASNTKRWRILMQEGRNRQIRRTFAALGYNVVKLHRTNFGSYNLDNLRSGKFLIIDEL